MREPEISFARANDEIRDELIDPQAMDPASAGMSSALDPPLHQTNHPWLEMQLAIDAHSESIE